MNEIASGAARNSDLLYFIAIMALCMAFIMMDYL